MGGGGVTNPISQLKSFSRFDSKRPNLMTNKNPIIPSASNPIFPVRKGQIPAFPFHDPLRTPKETPHFP